MVNSLIILVFDKFSGDYNNTYYNEFNSKVSKTSNFLLSVFLNVAPSPATKEEIISLMDKFQTNLINDEKSQQKFFTIFSILNSLHKLLVIDKLYDEFMRMIETYTQFLKNYLNDSGFVIYLIREQVFDLVNNIRICLIDSPDVDLELKKRATVAIFKLATCFRIVDIYLELINILSKQSYFEGLDIVKYNLIFRSKNLNNF
jgi:hypothetical protein